MIRAYSDGGLLGINPNPNGGTYCYVLVNHPEETIHSEGSGVIAADVLGYDGFVSNNVSELYALCMAVLKTPEGREVHYYSDSEITLGRVFCLHRLNNVPDWLVTMRNTAHRHLKKVCLQGYTLLAGHPTKAHLKAGFHTAKRLPVSAWNVYCDSKCNEARAKWETENGR